MDNTMIIEVAAMAATAGVTAAVAAALFLRGRKAQEEVWAKITLEEGLAALRQVIADAAAAAQAAEAAEAAATAAAAKAATARAEADALAAKAADAQARINLMEEVMTTVVVVAPSPSASAAASTAPGASPAAAATPAPMFEGLDFLFKEEVPAPATPVVKKRRYLKG